MPTVDELRARVTEKGPWFVVDPGSRIAHCRSCHVMIYWAITDSGKRIPVDCDVPGGSHPGPSLTGRGVSHFATCPAAASFRRGRA